MPTALLVPETALLVPGVSGRTPVLAALAEAALEAARALVAGDPGRVLVIAPGAADRSAEASELCASLEPLGVAERHLGWPAPCLRTGCPGHGTRAESRAGTGAALALRLLEAAGWRGPTTVLELGASPSPERDELAVQHLDAQLLVVSSLSARRDESSPRTADPRAVPFDEATVADLLEPSHEAVFRLLEAEGQLALELGASGTEPWRELARRAGGHEVEAREEAAALELGMDYRVITWRWDA